MRLGTRLRDLSRFSREFVITSLVRVRMCARPESPLLTLRPTSYCSAGLFINATNGICSVNARVTYSQSRTYSFELIESRIFRAEQWGSIFNLRFFFIQQIKGGYGSNEVRNFSLRCLNAQRDTRAEMSERGLCDVPYVLNFWERFLKNLFRTMRTFLNY